MAIQSQPSRIPEPFAGSGTKNTIPATNATPSASQAASWASGFPPECSQPISAGGCPVPRNDVNGALNQLSQDFAFRQDGGIWKWSALADYDAQRVVRGSDGILYWSVQPSGPNVAAGAQDPTLDTAHTYWVSPEIPTMPVDGTLKTAVNAEWVRAWDAASTVPANLYVDAVNGDDSNSGYSSAEAKQTIAAILDLIKAANKIKPTGVTINVAPGSYTDRLEGVTGLPITYNCSENAILTNAFISNASYVAFAGKPTFSPPSGMMAISVSRFSVAELSDGLIIEVKNLNASCCVEVRQGGLVTKSLSAVVKINFSGTCTVSVGTIWCHEFCAFACPGTTIAFSGSVSGPRYNVSNVSSISDFGSPTAIPGTSNGTVGVVSAYV